MAENFPNMRKEIDIHIQEAQRVPNKSNPKDPIPRHIVIKVKDKERNLKAAREKQLMYKGTAPRPAAEYSTETLWAERVGKYIQSATKRKLPIKNTLLGKAVNLN